MTASNKTFWAILADVTRLPENSFYLFDHEGHYDKLTFPDIARPNISYELKGILEAPTAEKKFDEIDLIVMYGRFKGLTFREIAKIAHRDHSQLVRRYHKIMRLDSIAGIVGRKK